MAPRYKLNSDDYLDPSFLGSGNVKRLIDGINQYGATALDVHVGGTGNPGSYSDRKPLVYDQFSGKIVSATIAKSMLNNRFVDTDLLASDYAFYAVDSGSGNSYVISFNVPITAYKPGQRFLVRATHPNTGAATLNVDGQGAKNLVNADGSALKKDQIVVGQIFEAVFNATDDRFHTWVPSEKSEHVYVTEQTLITNETATGGVWKSVDAGAALSTAGYSGDFAAVMLRVVCFNSSDAELDVFLRKASGQVELQAADFQQEIGEDQDIVVFPTAADGTFEYKIESDGGPNANIDMHVVGYVT